jgi:hypothetical protein
MTRLSAMTLIEIEDEITREGRALFATGTL